MVHFRNQIFFALSALALILTSCGAEKNDENKVKSSGTALIQAPYNDSSWIELHREAMAYNGLKDKVAKHYEDLYLWHKENNPLPWVTDHLMVQYIYWAKASDESLEELYQYSKHIMDEDRRTMAARAAYQWITTQTKDADLKDKAAQDIPSDQPDIYTVIKDLEYKLVSSMKDSIQLQPKVALDYVMLVELAAIDPGSWNEGGLYMNRAAGILRNNNQFDLADQFYDWVMRLYPNTDDSANALFYKAFLHDGIGNNDKAKALYAKFISDYPEHELKSQASILYNNVGKSDQEILEEILSKQKATEQ